MPSNRIQTCGHIGEGTWLQQLKQPSNSLFFFLFPETAMLFIVFSVSQCDCGCYKLLLTVKQDLFLHLFDTIQWAISTPATHKHVLKVCNCLLVSLNVIHIHLWVWFALIHVSALQAPALAPNAPLAQQ